MSQIIIGTAGHIDHGKTALVKALTGIDTDRLKEEKERGLTIDLGFAHFGEQATIIDVPGHEKFIRNMVAGVSTIDLVLFVIAADDGVMPQTREHFDILKILQVRRGIIVLTKIDLVEEDWLNLVQDDVRSLVAGSFLENAPVVPVSSIAGTGIPELKKKVEALFAEIKDKQDKGIFWLPVDRAFTMKGFGTVITGTVLSGQANIGETLELLPQKEVWKIRGLQSHGHSVEKVTTGDRAAINLQAVEKQRLHRGNVLASPNYFVPSQRFDVRLQLLKSAPRALKSRTRVRVHVGTTEVMARVSLIGVKEIAPGDSGYLQLHLEEPAVSRRLDPFVIRQYSPTITIGGGIVLDPNAPRHKLSDPSLPERLKSLQKENPGEVVEDKLLSAEFSLRTVDELTSEISASKETVQKILDDLNEQQKVLLLKKQGRAAAIHQANFERLRRAILETIADFHKKYPAKLGMRKAEIAKQFKSKVDGELLNFALADLIKNQQIKESAALISLKLHEIKIPPELKSLIEKIDQLVFEEGFATSSEAEMAQKLSVDPEPAREALNIMIDLGKILRVEGNIYFHPKQVEAAKQKVKRFLQEKGEITVSQFKELLNGTSRKYAMPLLNYFDGSGVTEREGDVRILRG